MKIGTLTCDISACSNDIVRIKISYYIFKPCQIFICTYLTWHLVAHENELLHMQTQVGNQRACIFNKCQQNRKCIEFFFFKIGCSCCVNCSQERPTKLTFFSSTYSTYHCGFRGLLLPATTAAGSSNPLNTDITRYSGR
jgi:hypothetical protein